MNPIACLISSVKTQPLPEKYLCTAKEIYKDAKETFSGPVEIPSIPNLDHWFKSDIQKALSSILNHIEEESDAAMRNALKLALSSIIVRVSNQESDTRYAAVDNNYTADDVFNAFLSACKKSMMQKRDLCR